MDKITASHCLVKKSRSEQFESYHLLMLDGVSDGWYGIVQFGLSLFEGGRRYFDDGFNDVWWYMLRLHVLQESCQAFGSRSHNVRIIALEHV
jgi:hypothetical protein